MCSSDLLYRTVPTLRYVKDEAGDPLQRIGPLRERSHDEIRVFSGNHGRKMIEELEAGFSGSMPAAGLADLIHRQGISYFASPPTLQVAVAEAGLVDIRQEPAQYKLREPRDMRVVGEKPRSDARSKRIDIWKRLFS